MSEGRYLKKPKHEIALVASSLHPRLAKTSRITATITEIRKTKRGEREVSHSACDIAAGRMISDAEFMNVQFL
jgi:hypothetical protein